MHDPEFERRRQQLLVDDMIMILQNVRHLAFYRTVAATVPEELIRKALSEIQHDEASEIGDPVTYFLQEMTRLTEQFATGRIAEAHIDEIYQIVSIPTWRIRQKQMQPQKRRIVPRTRRRGKNA